MSINTYILDENHHPIKTPADKAFEWKMDPSNEHLWRVGGDLIDDIRISTVFLVTDHRYGNGPPVLFETMVFGGLHDNYMKRYTNWEDAEVGHKVTVAMVKNTKDDLE